MLFKRINPKLFLIWSLPVIALIALLWIVYQLTKQSSEFNAGDITMVVVTAGQSNAVGGYSSNRNDDGAQDKIHDRVFVWAQRCKTCKHQWVLADVRNQSPRIWNFTKTQIWTKREPVFLPDGVTSIGNGTVQGQSHAGFQIARHIAENSNEVIGIIPTGYNAMPIDSWWSDAGPEYLFPLTIQSVDNAIANLRNVHNVDVGVGIFWWMQGETDVINAADDNFVLGYMEKLNAIINAVSQKKWFAETHSRLFVANHIYVKKPMIIDNPTEAEENEISSRNDLIMRQKAFNAALDTLNIDDYSGEDADGGVSSLHTCSNKSELMETIPKPTDEIHFSAQTLASIGQAVADKYLNRNNVLCGNTAFLR